MEKSKFLLMWLMVFPICIFAQESKKGDFSMGVYGGYGNTINAFRASDVNGFSFYGIPKQYSLGVDFNFYVSAKQSVRLGLEYSEAYYGVLWSDKYDMDKTEVTRYNINARLNFDFKAYQLKKLQLFVSPGIIGEFVVADQDRLYLDDGSIVYTKYNVYPEDEYPSVNLGFNVSLIAKYNVTSRLGITLTPYYDIFLMKFSDDSSPYQRYGGLLGVELSF